MPANKATSVIPAGLSKALADKLYDKQRNATLKIERIVLDALDADDEQKIYALVAELATDYATSEKESARIGGLVALAATAVALTHINIRPFLPHMVPPMVSALSDGESKVRYFACESLYNVAKVSRGNILRWFNDIFDGLARVTADSVKTVKDGADYLDRLIKDIVAEQAATCIDWFESEGSSEDLAAEHVGDAEDIGVQATLNAADEDANDDTPDTALVMAAADMTQGPRLAFSLDKFVPLLSERMHTYKPSTRLYLIEWIRVLDSVPGLDLITYLPEFLDGLLRFLSDPSDDVRNKTQSLLGELLNEIRECVELQSMHADIRNNGNTGLSSGSYQPPQFMLSPDQADTSHEVDDLAWGESVSGSPSARNTVSRARMRSSTLQSDVHVEGRFSAESQRLPTYHFGESAPSRSSSAFGHRHLAGTPTAGVTAAALGVLSDRPQSRGGAYMPGEVGSRSAVSLMSSALANGQLPGVTDELRMAARRKQIRSARAGGAAVLGSSVVIDFAQCVSILVPHIESSDQEIQGTALSWIYQFTWLCPNVIVASVPTLVNAVLPSVSHPISTHRRTAEDVNDQLYNLVRAAPDPVQRRVPIAQKSGEPASPQIASMVERPRPRPATRPLTPVTTPASSIAQQLVPSSPVDATATQLPGPRSRAGSLLHATAGSAAGSTAPSRVATPPPHPAPPLLSRRLSSAQSPTEAAVTSPVHSPELAPTEVQGRSRNVSVPGPEPLSELYEEVIDEPFNYEYAATAVMELFAKNMHEPTKVAGMQWLLLLHGKAPWRILTPEDMSFPVLLKMLGDSSEHVVKLDLELFAQISVYSQGGAYTGAVPAYEVDVREMPYLARFLGSLLQMFATDRALLETRGALMVRQLCVVLDPQLVFCLFARLLLLPRFSVDFAGVGENWGEAPVRSELYEDYEDEDDDSDGEIEITPKAAGEGDGLADLEFISVMVQHLSWILVTAPETETLRLTLRRYSSAVPLSAPAFASLQAVQTRDGSVSGGVRTSMHSDDSGGRLSRGRGGSIPMGRGRGASSTLAPLEVKAISSLTSLDSAKPPGSAGFGEAKPSKLVRAPTGSSSIVSGPKTSKQTSLASSRTGTVKGSSSVGIRSRGYTLDSNTSSSTDRMQRNRLDGRRLTGVVRRGLGTSSSAMDRARSALSLGLDGVHARVLQNRQSHGLFVTLFAAWSHNPASCLTLCLLSQHYETSARLINVFGQLTHDLTVSFLVQLDKLVQLIESPVFTFLRLQLLDPVQHPRLVRTLYGLLMLLPQSSAFAILRNRLSTVAMVPAGSGQFAVPAMNGSQGAQGSQGTDAGRGVQIHYHYHTHQANTTSSHTAGSDAASGSASAQQQQQQQQICSALGVLPSDVSELGRLLAVCSQQNQLTGILTESLDTLHVKGGSGTAMQILQELVDLQVVTETFEATNCGQCAGGAETTDAKNRQAQSMHTDSTDQLVDEYRVVRRRHAQALARH
ncbi:hypothetical protein LPJ58_002898 [Coemansia sp. RSA 1591]|nr:hypothetical protein LPJ58_002898 [Coemansia sp. RSA 1591]KAJ2155698.1 hypothetical protein J3F82_000181 [Coemansia sp. RSA 637]